MNVVVLDASVILRWAFEDEPDREGALRVAEALSAREVRVVGPPNFHMEVAAALVVAIRSGRMDQVQASAILDLLGSVIILQLQPHAHAVAVFRLAMETGLRVPDAAYLEAARREAATLISADKAQLAAAGRLGMLAVDVATVPAWTP